MSKSKHTPKLCPTCRHRPSERTTTDVIQVGDQWEVRHEDCSDPIHDLADAGPEMYEALRKIAIGSLGYPDSALASKEALSNWMWTVSQQCARVAIAKAETKVSS